MSYIKEKFFNHIVVLGDIDNNDPENLYGTVIFSGGKKYVIDDFYTDDQEMITTVCCDVYTAIGYQYEHININAFLAIVIDAEKIVLPEYEQDED